MQAIRRYLYSLPAKYLHYARRKAKNTQNEQHKKMEREKEAKKKAEELSESAKSPHFVQLVKEVIEE